MKMRNLFTIACAPALAIFAGLVWVNAARASTVYAYVGTNYDSIQDETPPLGTYTTAMRLTGTLTVTNALGPSAPFQVITDIESFSFFDGRILYTDQNASVFKFEASTDATGTINRWSIIVDVGTTNLPFTPGQQFASFFSEGGIFTDDNDRPRFAEAITATTDGLDAANSPVGQLGTWSTTPLPTALPLFATGLGALGLLGWRRKRKQAA